MLLKRLFQAGIAGLALGGSARAADPDTVRLGRADSKDVTAAPIATTADDDTDLTRGGGHGGGHYGGYHGGYGGYRGGYYGGYGRSYYGGYGRGYYGGYGGYGYGRSYISIGLGYGGFYGGYGRGYYGGGYGGYYYPSYYSYPSYYYGISGSDAPTVNLGITTAQPLVTPLEMPVQSPAPLVHESTETLKINSPAPRATVKYAAFGDK